MVRGGRRRSRAVFANEGGIAGSTGDRNRGSPVQGLHQISLVLELGINKELINPRRDHLSVCVRFGWSNGCAPWRQQRSFRSWNIGYVPSGPLGGWNDSATNDLTRVRYRATYN